jgi:hypothetical protein
MTKTAITRKANTQLRNERLHKRFNELYNDERKRIDDVYAQLCQDFSLSEATIEKIIKGYR